MYSLVAQNPSLYLSVLLILLCFVLISWAAITYFESLQWKIVLVIVFGAVVWGTIHWARHQWETALRAAVLSQLSISLSVPTLGNAWDSMIKIQNNSNLVLADREVTCNVISLTTEHGALFHVPIGFVRRDDNLSPGGDAQTIGCLGVPGGNRAFRISENIDCADVVISTRFTIEARPSIHADKNLRFVYGFGGQKEWVAQSVNRTDSYCVPKQP